MTEDKIKEYQGYLKRGDKKKLAELAGVKADAVTKFFAGKNKKSVVAGALQVLAEKRKKEMELKLNTIDHEEN